MTANSSSPTRREVLATSAAAGATSLLASDIGRAARNANGRIVLLPVCSPAAVAAALIIGVAPHTAHAQRVDVTRVDLQHHVGGGNAAELATYIVEKGKPLVTLAE